MKKYTHAWLAFMAIKRLETANIAQSHLATRDSIIQWFMNHKDGVIRGAWYPDSIIKDNSTSHILKFEPAVDGEGEKAFRLLPSKQLIYRHGRYHSPLYKQPYEMMKGNLPHRCEALAHAVIDNLKMQEKDLLIIWWPRSSSC
jgi:hypothetical protein